MMKKIKILKMIMVPKNHDIKLNKQKKVHTNYCKVFMLFVLLYEYAIYQWCWAYLEIKILIRILFEYT
jgi:hypothetical protein